MSRHTRRTLARLRQHHPELDALIPAILEERGPHRALTLLVALFEQTSAPAALDAIRDLQPRLSPASRRFLRRKGLEAAP